MLKGLNLQESNQSVSTDKRYRYKGKEIKWTEEETERFWKLELLNSMKEVAPDFIVDDRNRNTLAALYDYVWHKDGRLDPRKGLFLWGPIGTGKSTLIKGLQKYLGKINKYCYGYDANIGFRFLSAVEIALMYAKSGLDGIVSLTERERMSNLAIDELGKEPTDSKYFGTSINVMQTILQLRYEARNQFITHVTTNLDPNFDLPEKYSAYIADRVKEMFNVIPIKGETRRTQ